MFTQIIKLISITFLSTSFVAHAQVCSKPKEVDFSRYPALAKRAAYASFIADRCEINNDIDQKMRGVINFFVSENDRLALLDSYKTTYNNYNKDAGFIGVNKRCYLESAKTKALIKQVSQDISDFYIYAQNSLIKYEKDLTLFNDCYASKSAVQNINAQWRRSYSDDDWVLVLQNAGDRSAYFELRCYRAYRNSKSFSMSINPRSISELGFLEGWYGNFVYGDSCEAVYDGEVLWTIRR